MYDVTALGEILIDFTPYGSSEGGRALFEQNPGGAPANVLAALQNLGQKTAVIGKVGDDMHGKLLKETLAYEGVAAAASGSPREILKAAFATYDFIDGDLWLEMLKTRNDLSRIYDGDAARAMVDRIVEAYIPEFRALKAGLDELYEGVLFGVQDE